MSIKFNCRHCGHGLRLKDSAAGKKGKCPACGQIIVVPQPEARPDAPSAGRRRERAQSLRVTRVIDPDAVIHRKRHYFNNDDDKYKALKMLRGMFPHVTSCYEPSGQRSDETMPALCKGLLVAAPVAACAALIALPIVSWILKLFGYMDMGATYTQIFSGVVSILITFSILGGVAGATMGPFSRSGMNRDPSIAGYMGAVAAVLGALVLAIAGRIIFGFLSASTASPFQAARAGAVRAVLGPFDPYWRGLFPYITMMGGMGLAGLVAAGVAAGAVGQYKFCEKCEEPMTARNQAYLVPLSVDGAKRLVKVLAERPHDRVEIFRVFDLYPGRDCDTQLFVCPSCGIGIVEARIHFCAGRVKIQGGQPTEDTDDLSWLVASDWLTADEVKALKPFQANVMSRLPLPVKFEYMGNTVNIKLPD